MPYLNDVAAQVSPLSSARRIKAPHLAVLADVVGGFRELDGLAHNVLECVLPLGAAEGRLAIHQLVHEDAQGPPVHWGAMACACRVRNRLSSTPHNLRLLTGSRAENPLGAAASSAHDDYKLYFDLSHSHPGLLLLKT